MRTTRSYHDRLVDLEFLQTIESPEGSQGVSVSFTKSQSKFVTGIQKLAQRYCNLFLTILGDIQFAQDIGTDFIRAVVGGNIANFGRFTDVFAVANTRTIDKLKENSEGLPQDEVIDTTELLDFDVSVSTGTVMLKVKISSMAGDAIEYVIPTTTLKGE